MRAKSSGAPGRALRTLRSARALDGEGGSDGALGVVLLGARIAEEGHKAVAQPLQDVPAERRHRFRRFVEIGVDQVAPVLGVELGRQTRRADEIAEHDRDRTALGSFR